MKKRVRLSSLFSAVFLCLLLILVSACDSQPVAGGKGTPTPAGSSSTAGGTPTVQTVQMPPTQTSCPAANTARAAVIRPLARGNLQNLVYVFNEVPDNTSTSTGHLRRYDVSNGHKANLVDSGQRIDQAQVSADGQWVLFLSIPDPRGDSQHSAMLQLIRMDGQGLQTLYCFPTANYSGSATGSKLPISLQWSVDEKSILISVNTSNDTSQIFLIDVASGAIRQLFEQHDAQYSFSVVTWLDNTHFYIVKQGNSSPTPPATIYMMDASMATVANPGLVNILTTNTRMSYYSLDSNYDGTLLYSSYCSQAASPFRTSIQVGPAKGGARHAIYQEQPSDCIQTLRSVSSNTLLMLVQVANAGSNSFKDQMWKMNLLSNSAQTLTTLTSPDSGQTGYSLNPFSQFPWSNVSRDGSYYAIQAIDPVANNRTVLVGPMNGGDLTPVAVTDPGNSSVSLAGWTTL